MKELTIKELSDLTYIPAGTIRAWTLKPVPGKPYSSSDINYEQLRKGLERTVENWNFDFKIEDIVIIKAERTQKEYVKASELKEGDTIVLHNYSLQTVLTLIKIVDYKKTKLFVFQGKGYKAYDLDELNAQNIKLERVKE